MPPATISSVGMLVQPIAWGGTGDAKRGDGALDRSRGGTAGAHDLEIRTEADNAPVQRDIAMKLLPSTSGLAARAAGGRADDLIANSGRTHTFRLIAIDASGTSGNKSNSYYIRRAYGLFRARQGLLPLIFLIGRDRIRPIAWGGRGRRETGAARWIAPSGGTPCAPRSRSLRNETDNGTVPAGQGRPKTVRGSLRDTR